MILPGSYLVTILLLIAGMICWGSWGNLFKATGKWRFELFSIDFAFGAVLVGLVTALTLGSLGWDGFSFIDDIRIAGKRQELFAFGSGAVFNLGNMLLIGAISLGGMSLAFPVGLGVALIVGILWSFVLGPTVVNPLLLGLACAFTAAAIVLDAICFKSFRLTRLLTQIREGKSKSTRKTVSSKAIVVAAIAGVLLGSFYPLLDLSKNAENGVGPYTMGAIFMISIFITTFVYNLFLMNLPIHGQPVEFRDYFKGVARQHLFGFLAGAIWSAGTMAGFVAGRAEGVARAGAAMTSSMAHGATVIAAIWGLVYWKEFSGADTRVRGFLTLMVVLLTIGVGVVAVAPVYGKH